MPVRDPDVQVTVAGDGARVVHLSGAWDIRALESRAAALQSALRDAGPAQVSLWDLTQIQRFDHIGAMLVWRTWGRCRPSRLQLNREHEIFFGACESAEAVASAPAAPDRFPLLLALGRGVWAVSRHVLEILELFGQLLIDAATVVRQPVLRPWREFSAAIYKIGAQALGITALVGFLIGVVLSYLSAEQLRLVGADVFIVNILGVGIVRELGPVVCSILVAGRSGSAITAQLGVMRVTEELDALSVMGISNTLRLILPKMAAIAVALPLLVLWTSGVALVGGAVSAKAELGMSFFQFFSALPAAVPEVNLWLGVGKGVVFGVLIALIACHFGLRIQPNTESLAAGTTRSVVTSITAVIVADAIIAVIFSDVGWS
ncbi:MAG: ABC transporter permease [Betaproteobacteria bacterium]|nr:MAG: ABC transporter permease [Betaproteobacteria bacterium]TMH54342.1 MAG: ABC transporter permease [Betaproteobacteria bacterium]